MDVLRHLGRAQLSSFAGGAPGNRAFDQDQWKVAPYNEEDLQLQIDRLDDLYGDAGANLQGLLSNYVDGINAYIGQAKLDITKMPGEYAAIGRPQGADPWKGTDVVATASLVGAIFGKGGGEEITMVKVLQAFRARFGRKLGTRLFYDFRSSEDPEAPTTIHKRRFTYEATPKRHARGSVALPDRGTLRDEPEVVSGGSTSSSSGGLLGLGILGTPSVLNHAQSNALVVSARESASGHPLAVFGPQVAYFAPQILMEQDVHAPGWDARGAAFPGVNVLVQLGHGRDYAWSATSAGQDIIDTFAVDLCNADGSAPSLDSVGYMFRGACRPMEVLERSNSWSPNLADSTPAGSETLRAHRTALGIVVARATIKGKPVAYTRLRSTYMHEADSALGFKDFNDPAVMSSPAGFAGAAYKIGYTFNWLYVDD
jgi:acyl-homoserine lactone acylase PvdQ